MKVCLQMKCLVSDTKHNIYMTLQKTAYYPSQIVQDFFELYILAVWIQSDVSVENTDSIFRVEDKANQKNH
jgi:hypothetical protein